MARHKLPRSRRAQLRREERNARYRQRQLLHQNGGASGATLPTQQYFRSSGNIMCNGGGSPEPETFITTTAEDGADGNSAGGNSGSRRAPTMISGTEDADVRLLNRLGTTGTQGRHEIGRRTAVVEGETDSVEDQVDMAATRAGIIGSSGSGGGENGNMGNTNLQWLPFPNTTIRNTPGAVQVEVGVPVQDHVESHNLEDDEDDRAYTRQYAARVRLPRPTDVDDTHALQYARPDIRVVQPCGTTAASVITDQPATPTESTDLSTSNANHSLKYSVLDAFINLVSIMTYLFDVGSDIFLVYVYYSKPHWWWFGLTLTFVLVPAVVMSCFSLKWYIVDHQALKRKGRNVSTCRWVSRAGFLVLQLSPVLRYIDTVVYGVRSQRNEQPTERRHWYDQMLYEDTDSALLRLFECFMEAAPQLCLQLYILTIFGPKGALYLVIAQCIGAFTSLVSMAWALCAYHRSLRLSLHSKTKMTWAGVALQFAWHFCTIGARIIAISLFASYFRGWVFVLAGAHFCAMLVWVLIQNTHFCETKCEEFCFDVVAALVYVFCYFNLTEGHTRLRYLFYYTVVYSENAAMILVWYLFTSTLDVWYRTYALVAVLGGFLFGIGFQVLYYLRFHPNNLSGDSTKRIKVCRPLDELVGDQEDKSELEMSDMTDFSSASNTRWGNNNYNNHQGAGSPNSRLSGGNSGYMEDSDSADCIQPLMGDIC